MGSLAARHGEHIVDVNRFSAISARWPAVAATAEPGRWKPQPPLACICALPVLSGLECGHPGPQHDRQHVHVRMHRPNPPPSISPCCCTVRRPLRLRCLPVTMDPGTCLAPAVFTDASIRMDGTPKMMKRHTSTNVWRDASATWSLYSPGAVAGRYWCTVTTVHGASLPARPCPLLASQGLEGTQRGQRGESCSDWEPALKPWE